MRKLEGLLIEDVGVFKKPKKAVKEQIVDIKEQAEKCGKFMLEILDGETDRDAAIELKKEIEFEGE